MRRRYSIDSMQTNKHQQNNFQKNLPSTNILSAKFPEDFYFCAFSERFFTSYGLKKIQRKIRYHAACLENEIADTDHSLYLLAGHIVDNGCTGAL